VHEIRTKKLPLTIIFSLLVVLAINLLGFLVLFFTIDFRVFPKLHFEQQLLSAFIVGVFFFTLWHFKESLRKRFPYELIIIGILSFVLIAQSTLLTIDRSRSLYILSWAHHHKIQYQDNAIILKEIESQESKVVTAIAQRIEEHIARGLMAKEGNKIFLTQRGEVFYKVADVLANVYRLNGWKQNKL
jgi:hypothetical protein